MRIPLPVWETIRRFSEMESLVETAERTDAEINTLVENLVQKRMQQSDKLGRIFGFLSCGSADSPIETQLEQGVFHYKKEREQARKLLAEIDKSQIANGKEGES